jgi:hypothetical protein
MLHEEGLDTNSIEGQSASSDPDDNSDKVLYLPRETETEIPDLFGQVDKEETKMEVSGEVLSSLQRMKQDTVLTTFSSWQVAVAEVKSESGCGGDAGVSAVLASSLRKSFSRGASANTEASSPLSMARRGRSRGSQAGSEIKTPSKGDEGLGAEELARFESRCFHFRVELIVATFARLVDWVSHCCSIHCCNTLLQHSPGS